ncbi:MAG TPA: helix-turn-helix domain-containing protein [Bacillota bacterium]|nr:helix-turn-helix domain-containing protein [Bacillota bacterium]
MVIFLIVISFIIHLIVILTGFIMYSNIQKKQSNAEEVALLLEEYLKEIKHENSRLLQQVESEQNKRMTNHTSLMKDKEAIENIDEKSDETSPTYTEFVETKVKKDDTYDLSLQAQVLQLHSDGQSIEQIARTLNCGKTEVELYIQMNKK